MSHEKAQKAQRVFLRGVGSFVLLMLFCGSLKADDGYRLWLRYEPLSSLPRIGTISVQGKSATFDVIRNELSQGCSGLLGTKIEIGDRDDASVVVGLPQTSTLIRELHWEPELTKLGPEGFRIRTVKDVIVIASTTDIGALYGTFHFLRLLQTEQRIDRLQIDEAPRLKLRLLNHWDNLDGSIERGYAGKSLWMGMDSNRRLLDYARANASIGINGSVLNNVNANSEFLTAKYLAKFAAIADVFRPFGLRVYLSPRFSAPIELGKLPTADPLDPAVIQWWKQKTDEIYKLIPDFGGFLVKDSGCRQIVRRLKFSQRR